MKKTCLAIVSHLSVLFLVATVTYAGGDSVRTVIDDRGLAWELWGAATGIPKIDPRVKGGIVQRITIPAKPKNSWEAGSWAAVTMPVHKGDVLLFAFWARAETKPANSDAILLYGEINEYAPPNRSVTPKTPMFVTGDWKIHYGNGIADKDYPPDSLTVSLQLGTGQQTIDLGPLIITNYGPGYNLAKLPHE